LPLSWRFEPLPMPAVLAYRVLMLACSTGFAWQDELI
jgi:hypothetical protein